MSIGEPGTAPADTQEQGPAGQPDSRRRWWLLAAGSAVVAAALAGGVTAALPGAPAAPSPLSAVTSALARTAAQSYTFGIDTVTRSQTREVNSDLVAGAYDPRRHLGAERLTARSTGRTERTQVRFIGAYVYTSVSPASGFGQLWDKSPLAAAMAGGMPPGDLYGFVSDQPVNPAELNVVLRSAGTAVHESGSVSGPGWTGIRYTFTATLANGQEPFSGDVNVDRAGRVRLMTITAQRREQAGGKPFVTTTREINLGDFGAPVPVNAPPASQAKYTSGTPYWGFYF